MGTGRSSSKGQSRFAMIPSANIPRSKFSRNFTHKTTFDAGLLVPIFVDEGLPGDTFNLKETLFGRLATPLHPVMDNLWLETFYFAVPNRLVWNNWQKFNGEQENPGDSVDYLVPQVVAPTGGFSELEIYDYMGVPTKVEGLSISALWPRAYNLIWNEWFRDENLQPSQPVAKDDGPDSDTAYKLMRRGKRHDYFTASLPWPQKGDPVTLSLAEYATVISNEGTGIGGDDGRPTLEEITSGEIGTLWSSPGSPQVQWNPLGAHNNEVLKWTSGENTGLVADLRLATASTVNDLRTAFQLQRLKERDARGGSRYTEVLRSHFGVISPDARLQRPEFLGGSRQQINIRQVEQTSETQTTPQGNLAAFGIVAGGGAGFSKSFVEHVVIIGLACVRADLNYQQGLDRMWSRRTRWDFYWPALSHIGEQQVLQKEIYADGSAQDENVWGYQERYGEYRYKPSKITGQMRSNATTPLDIWHLAQDFASSPVLGDLFIQENPPISRIVAVPSEPDLILDMYFDLKCVRPMPTYGVPGMIDHF